MLRPPLECTRIVPFSRENPSPNGAKFSIRETGRQNSPQCIDRLFSKMRSGFAVLCLMFQVQMTTNFVLHSYIKMRYNERLPTSNFVSSSQASRSRFESPIFSETASYRQCSRKLLMQFTERILSSDFEALHNQTADIGDDGSETKHDCNRNDESCVNLLRLRKGSPSLPQHIAIIMDGNRRFAKARMMPSEFGHFQGKETLERVVR
jgi:hypothetical protein